jgi:hypothetical protein
MAMKPSVVNMAELLNLWPSFFHPLREYPDGKQQLGPLESFRSTKCCHLQNVWALLDKRRPGTTSPLICHYIVYYMYTTKLTPPKPHGA